MNEKVRERERSRQRDRWIKGSNEIENDSEKRWTKWMKRALKKTEIATE